MAKPKIILEQSLKIFDKNSLTDIIRDIDPVEVPAKYIDCIEVQYKDGTSLCMSGPEVNRPIPLNDNVNWAAMENQYRKIEKICVFIDTERLSQDVGAYIDSLFLGKLR